MLFLNLALLNVLGGNFDKIGWNVNRGWNRTGLVWFTCIVSNFWKDDVLNSATILYKKTHRTQNQTKPKSNTTFFGGIKLCDTSLLFPLLVYHFILPFTRGIKKPGGREGRVGEMNGSGSSVWACKGTEDVLQRAENSESAEMHWAVEAEFLFMGRGQQHVTLQIKEPRVRVFFFVSTSGIVKVPV